MNSAEKYPVSRYVKFERIVREKVKGGYYNIPPCIKQPEDAYETIMEIYHLEKECQEVLGILCLNTKNKVVATEIIHRGTANSSMCHPRDVFRYALTSSSTVSIIVFHNHPSGDTRPSEEDKQITRRLKEAGHMLGVEVLDHMIVAEDNQFTSLRDKGYMS